MNRKLLKWIRATAERRRRSDWIPPVVRGIVRGAAQRLQHRYHLRSMSRALSGRLAHLEDVEAFLCEHAVPLRIPLVLISQVQRSGGTLLSQLFDAHPELVAYPHELKVGFPVPDRWPPLEPTLGPDRNFRMMFDPSFPRFVRRGFTKGDHRNPERHNFFLIPRVQYGLFHHLFKSAPPTSARDILDHFFTAYFNAWLNYQGDLRQKRWITAFAPRLAHDEANMAAFFASYPDGRLIHIVRDPKSWYPSAKNHAASGFAAKGPEHTLNKWCSSAESMLRNRHRYGDLVIVLRFEDLVGRTEQTMRALASSLGIMWDPALLEPTFNGQLMRANSSFPVVQAGVIDAPLTRDKMLSEDECRLIETRCRAPYDRVLCQSLSIGEQTARLGLGA
jgi:hypothetical protein